jgi:hypothetical protein
MSNKTFGTESNTPYLIHINTEDRQKALKIIKEGLMSI